MNKILCLLLMMLIPTAGLGAGDFHFTTEDEAFLEMVQKKTFEFFLREHHPETGLVKDKANNFGPDTTATASIASTGFGLTAMIVASERGWVTKEEAQKYCTMTLRFFLNRMEENRGFFYHFVNWATGKRSRNTELSSIDTAILLAGALTAGEYFKETEVETLANQIYERVDFPWMLNGGKLLSMGWDPIAQKFFNLRWHDYNESFILYLLAIGSPTHPIPADSWHQVNKRIGIYGPHVLIYSAPLFTHQFPHIWFDFRNKNDGFVDYFENSRVATLVNRQFCLDHSRQHKTYSENVWGLTASMGPTGYRAYGAGPGGSLHDGTIAPTAAGGSIVFTPELSLNALKYMYANFKDRIWGKYGFSDAFNWDRGWRSSEVLGIDQGPILLMIENARSELIWKLFMRHPAVQRGMERIGFKPGTLKLKPPTRAKLVIDTLKTPIHLESPENRELGEVTDANDLSGDIFLAWDDKFLFVTAKIQDDSLIAKRAGEQIWRDDLLELFIDPQGDGFKWGSMQDIQLGLSPGPLGARSWVWPRKFDPVKRGAVQLEIKTRPDGYDIEAKIAWGLLGITPGKGVKFGLTPALHDIDKDGTEAKLTWFFLPDGKNNVNTLGEVTLESSR